MEKLILKIITGCVATVVVVEEQTAFKMLCLTNDKLIKYCKTFLFATSTIVKNVEFEYILLSEKFFEMATQCSDITFHHPSVVLSLLTFNPENTRLLRVGEAAL